MDRRKFLTGAVVTGAALASGKLSAQEKQSEEEFIGVLVDTTRCIGCRTCEVACAQANELEVPDIQNDGMLDQERTTSDSQWTVVNRYETDAGEVFVKRQCMHCWQPACGAACLTNAMYKTKEGPVIWRSNKCMGCRFCMVSCPYDAPKFEYDEWNPKLQKCNLCWGRLQQGEIPACVDNCPTGALTFGNKRTLMEIARVRIYNHPDRYVHHIYGEHEVGGTGWLYLAAAPFDQLGFRTDLGTVPYPEYAKPFLFAVPTIFFGLPTLLAGLAMMSKRDEQDESSEE
jgi:formate dehydrogenase iron-sulfur subunit